MRTKWRGSSRTNKSSHKRESRIGHGTIFVRITPYLSKSYAVLNGKAFSGLPRIRGPLLAFAGIPQAASLSDLPSQDAVFQINVFTRLYNHREMTEVGFQIRKHLC
jgi:hypothetical protein